MIEQESAEFTKKKEKFREFKQEEKKRKISEREAYVKEMDKVSPSILSRLTIL